VGPGSCISGRVRERGTGLRGGSNARGCKSDSGGFCITVGQTGRQIWCIPRDGNRVWYHWYGKGEVGSTETSDQGSVCVCVCVCVRPSVPKHVRENAEYLRREVFPCCLCLSHLIRNSKSSGSPLGVFPSELFFEFDVTSTPRPAIGNRQPQGQQQACHMLWLTWGFDICHPLDRMLSCLVCSP
jgi:hypothetical protein